MAVTDKTKSMMSLLPSWMKMAKDEESVGAKFLDAFGIEVEEVENYLEDIWNSMYLDSIDLTKADFCYKIPLARRDVVDQDFGIHINVVVEGETLPAMPTDTLRQFYSAEETSYMIDTVEGYVYVKAEEALMEEDIFQPFSAIDVNGALHYEYMIHHIWNVFDEFGMLVNLYRLPGERNEAFKTRILDVFKNPAGANKKGLKKGISRELGIAEEDIDLGAFTDKEYANSELINDDGTPTDKYLKYVEQVNSVLGFSWDHMNWGEVYWRSVEEDNLGLHYLPHIWDGYSAMWKDSEIDSGIGDGDDLLVTAPKEESSIREFKAYVGLHGTEESSEEMNPEIQFKYKITAKGKVPNTEYPMEPYKNTVIASEVVPLHFVLTAMRSFLYKTLITWDSRYGYSFQDSSSPGMEIVTGEDFLHEKEQSHLRLHLGLETADETVTPSMEEFKVEWTATDNTKHSFTMNTDEDFTSYNPMVRTELQHVEIVDHNIHIAKGLFSGIVDTHGSFSRGEAGQSVKIDRNGSIYLDLPKI